MEEKEQREAEEKDGKKKERKEGKKAVVRASRRRRRKQQQENIWKSCKHPAIKSTLDTACSSGLAVQPLPKRRRLQLSKDVGTDE